MSATRAARRVVALFVLSALVGWLLAAAGVTELPPTPYIVLDVVFDALVAVGLWTLYAPAWRVVVALTILSEVSLAIHPLRNGVLVAMGVVQLALLYHPALRRALGMRHSGAA